MLFDRRVQFEFEKRHDEIQYAELNRGEAILASLQQLAPEEAAREVLDLSAEELRAVLASALYDSPTKQFSTSALTGGRGPPARRSALPGRRRARHGRANSQKRSSGEIERGLGDDPDSPQPGD